MSTYWHIVCLDCPDDDEYGNESGGVNHGEELLARWLQARPAIDAFAATNAYQRDVDHMVVYGYYEGPDLFNFIAHHKGHRLEIRSEYGDTYDLERGEVIKRASVASSAEDAAGGQ